MPAQNDDASEEKRERPKSARRKSPAWLRRMFEGLQGASLAGAKNEETVQLVHSRDVKVQDALEMHVLQGLENIEREAGDLGGGQGGAASI